ncbi:hypothetical protein [Streptomyces sp. NPDC048361]|uniref:hypothetical protein n=1 Tax=Streptomyces sp. NPDC048361 TaxID=3154720 RepID=UPI003438F003
MSTCTRIALRAATAAAVLAGTFLVLPGAASAASGPCQVTEKIPSVFGGMSVSLTSDPETGPIAVLRDAKGGAVATVDRAHPTDLADGIKIEEPKDGKAVFFQRSQGGDTAWQSHDFPALPAFCLVSGTYTLVDGEKVKVSKDAAGHYIAYVATSGKTVLRTYGMDVDGFYAGMHLTLNSATGVVRSEYTVGRSGCTVTTVVTSVYQGGWSVKLTNSTQGPKAVLRDSQFKTVSTVDRTHPNDKRLGVIIDGANTPTPRLGQRTQGGDMPYRYTAFPKLPAGCANTTPAKTPAPLPAAGTPAASTPAQNGGQTAVVPKGAVAAGAEFKQGGDDKGVLIAGGAAVAAAGAVGFVAVRRRSAARI